MTACSRPAARTRQLLIAGTPGSLFDFVCGLLARAAEVVPAAIIFRHCGPDEAWVADTDAATDRKYILMTNYPSASFLGAVRDGELPAVVVIDSSLRSFLDLREAGHDAMEIARNLSACATQLGEVSASPAALHLGPHARENPGAAQRAIFRHASWNFPSNTAGITDNATRTGPFPGTNLPHEASLVGGVLDPAFHFAATGKRRELTWPRDCLFWGDRPDQPAPAILDLTGPARVIAYGPYFHVAPGHWIAQAQFAFSPAARGAKLALEFHGAGRLARCSFRVEHAGIFRIDLPIQISSARETIELRLVLEQGAIEGHLGLDAIRLLPA